MKLQEKIITVLFGTVLIISGLTRFNQTKNYNFPFTYDQARDMLEIRALGEFKDLAVMGPTTSINGLRLGPFYYYVNLPAYWIGRGNPQALVDWNIILFLVSGMAIFWFFRKRNIVLGLVTGSLFLAAPQMFNLTRYFWNANMATYLSVYFYLALWNFLEKKDKKGVFWLGVTSGLLTQFEAAFGIVCILFAILVIVINKKVAWWKNFLAGIVPWFLPQIVLEIKNKFQMSKLFLGMMTGTNQVLGEKLTFKETFLSHADSFKNYFEGQLMVPFWGGLVVLILAIGLIFVFKKYRKYEIYFLGFLGFAFGFYLLIYHYPIKHWYLDGLRIWYCFVMGIAVAGISKYKNLALGLIVLLLIKNSHLAIKDQLKIIGKEEVNNPKNLYNLIRNIDKVYSHTKEKGFEAYTYVPEIYDFPNQYLYWWYGNKKYGYMPGKVSYSLNSVPEYIRQQGEFYKNIKENEDERIALIYETKSIYQEWLKQFDEYCIEEGWQAIWGTITEIRKKCK